VRLLVHTGFLVAGQSDVRRSQCIIASRADRARTIKRSLTDHAPCWFAIQQKLAQETLQRSEAYLAESQKLTHTGSWVWDACSQKVLYCSEEMVRIFGLDQQESLPLAKVFGSESTRGSRLGKKEI